MARASEGTEEKEKKTPRKRVSRATPRVAVSTESEPETPRRKAPTTVTREGTKSYKGIYIPALILLFGLGIAVAIGFSDEGQINTVSVVNERNARVSSGETISGESTATNNTIVPVQNVGQGLVDGGLQGTGAPVPIEPAPVVEPTASSTEEQATSTESGEATTEAVDENTESSEPETEGSTASGEVTTE